MNIIETMLAQTSQEALGSIIRYYTDEEYYNVNMTEHLNTWARNKQHIFELFGNKLKVEREVETSLPSTAIRNKLNVFLDAEFAAPKFNIIKVFLKALTPNEIASNTLSHDFKMFDTTFKAGIKVSKCFRNLIKKDWLDEANTKYSMFLQSLKAKGIAVLSIDPIDYITMSANNSGWESCHAPDGGYRSGTVAYMMDGSSIISYVKSSDDCVLPDGTTHANKIWRQIVLVNWANTYALQARQYPNENDANALTVGEMLKDLMEKANEWSYQHGQADVYDSRFEDLQDNHEGNILYYNDIYNHSFDKGYYIIPAHIEFGSFRTHIGEDDFPIITVGHDVPCLCGCGGELYDGDRFFAENQCNDYDSDEYYDDYED